MNMECHGLRLVRFACFSCAGCPSRAFVDPLFLLRCISPSFSFVSFVSLAALSSRSPIQVITSAWMVAARDIVITVGGNTTDNGTTTFVPQRVDATRGDVVVFNCTLLPFLPLSRSDSEKVTNGNHTATESTFSAPCIPAHETNETINGFDSGFRNTQPGTVGTILTVPITYENENHTFWFYDYNTCGEGGVGVINNNESSGETLAGFTVRMLAVFTPQLAAFHLSHTHIRDKPLTHHITFPAKCHPSEWHHHF